VDLNPADPLFADFLESQARLHVSALGANFSGFAVDRLDHVSQWNMRPAPGQDDGLAWCGSPCYPLLTPWNAALKRVSEVVWAAKEPATTIVTANFVGAQRVDVLGWMDGIHSEDFLNHLSLVYASGFSTTGKPPNMLWTYGASQVLSYPPNPDAYFAQHVLFKAFPYAPVLGNDHSIQPSQDPSGAVQALYAAWGPLFKALQGGCWWTAPFPVLAESVVLGADAGAANRSSSGQHAADGGGGADTLVLNGFTRGGGCTDVSAEGGFGNGPVQDIIVVAVSTLFASPGSPAVVLSIADPFETAPASVCASIMPGGEWESVTPPATPNSTTGRWWFPPFKMQRGAVMLRCSR
jgi:hypothetical protein